MSVRKNLVALPTPSLRMLETDVLRALVDESIVLNVSILFTRFFSRLSAPVSNPSEVIDSADLVSSFGGFLVLPCARDDIFSSDLDRELSVAFLGDLIGPVL